MTKTSWWACASLLVPGLALAQEPPPPPPPTSPPGAGVQPVETSDPILPNLLPTRDGATIDLALDYVDVNANADVYVFASRVHGQYMTPQGFGGYVIVPFALVTGDDASGDTTQLGNIEVGGLFRMQQSPTMNIQLRGGVSIDTQGEPDSLDSLLFNLAAHATPRPTDAFPFGGLNTTWARAQVQVIQKANKIAYGGMIGADIPVDGTFADSGGFDALVNAAAAIGYHDTQYGASAGLTFLQSVSDGDDNNTFSIFMQGNMAINPSARIYGGIGLPLDNDFVDATAVMFGVRAGM